jgi:hypothetical protein
MQNEDIQDLVDKIRDFKSQNPGAPIPYQRFSSPVGDFNPILPAGVAVV